MAYRRTPAVEERLSASRARMIDVATTLVSESGYAGCSMALIASRAEVGTGTLYRQFDSKGHLFADVFRAVCSREVDAASEAGEAAPDGVAAVSAVVRTFAERALRAPTLAYALLVEPVDPLVEAERLLFRQSFRAAVEQAIERAIRDRQIPDQDAVVTSAALVGAIGEALVVPLARGEAAPDLIDNVLTFARRSLGTQEPS